MGLLGSITGSDQAKAAKRAAAFLQAQGRLNIKDFNQSFDDNIELLQPEIERENLAQNNLLQLLQSGDFINDPNIQRDIDFSVDSLNKRFAGAGKSLSSERGRGIVNATNSAVNQGLNRLLTLGNTGGRSNAINLRNARDNSIANSRLGIGNAFAAGQIGAANARTAGVNNLIKLGETAFTAAGTGGFGAPGA